MSREKDGAGLELRLPWFEDERAGADLGGRGLEPKRDAPALGRLVEQFDVGALGAREIARAIEDRDDIALRGIGSEAERVLDESPLSTAVGYARNQRVALHRFLDDGRLPLSNNISELHLRREVLGRKNWLFVGSDDAALVNTVFVSLLASARMHRLDPQVYLRDLFCLLPSWPKHRLLELAPVYWQKTLEQPETQQRLDSNVFRRVLLSPPS